MNAVNWLPNDHAQMNRAGSDDAVGFDYRWERIIAAILDHCRLDDVTIFGISYGGWLALRAGAFEPRICRIVASSVSFDVNRYDGWFAQRIA